MRTTRSPRPAATLTARRMWRGVYSAARAAGSLRVCRIDGPGWTGYIDNRSGGFCRIHPRGGAAPIVVRSGATPAETVLQAMEGYSALRPE